MASIRKNAKSGSPTDSLNAPSEQAPLGGLAIGAPWILAAVFLIAGVFSIPPHADPRPDPAGKTQALHRRNFAFMQTTSSWAGPTVALNYEAVHLELGGLLANASGRNVFLYPSQTPAPRRTKPILSQFSSEFFGLSNPWSSFKTGQLVIGFDLNDKDIYNFLLERIAAKLSQPPADARLVIENGRAVEFQPHRVGFDVNIPGTIAQIKLALFTGRSQTSVAGNIIQPRAELKNTNGLGIQELVALGESDFTGSSASRMHNIRMGADKFRGVILKPGEEFSFNHFLGEVTSAAGFQPELVIKSTGTVPELGGGLCQVSTTAFRAALYGGLPITARKNHSYAVKYYAPQGTDATIYPGAVDFKFINDTPAFLLIHTRMEGKKLFFEYYGTKDNRKVSIDGPYQYDFAAGGAMKARLARVVEKNGETATEDFFSKYVSKDLFPTVYEFPTAAPAISSPQTEPPAAASPTENP